ncbi:DEAD/DEAH box helicase [Pimelobacter simplex]|uniref:DEAD/DEAH box helicase n=1 Tax=Nocardioides simplex TaxID=2045 RepID=UPI00214F6641|nr:ATP-binding domain-containing protein [Pimelobacter simplex]UUW92564.1 ATP-binding domain-containing protein [Pimelobacter simplex]UUW96391.1 ATP-binding domain-containing protein [Pimelobacter simplex]
MIHCPKCLRHANSARLIEIRLLQHADLVRRRSLKVEVQAITFAPALGDAHLAVEDGSEYPVVNQSSLAGALEDFEWDGGNDDLYRRTVSALQSISGIRRTGTTRTVETVNSRGAKLKRLESSIATLDAQQSRAVIETAHDVQRIRGLAGSGKTVVLALKAAYLHAQHPGWRIGVTFNTRSLSAQFRRLINTFTIEQTGDEPDWSKIHVLTAWGAPGGPARDGVYHRFCADNGVAYRDFGRAKTEFGSIDPLGWACAAALKDATSIRQSFDVLLVDEAQDLPADFLRMCYEMLGDEKLLVYAYDELQTLNGAGLAPPEEIFGLNDRGEPRVRFDVDNEGGRRDIILEKCYRNSRPLLVTAHALGFGIYRVKPAKSTTGLVQIFEQKSLWDDIGYRVRSGQLEEGKQVALVRDEGSSPRFLEEHSPIEDLLEFRSFPTARQQAEWVAEQIKINLEHDELAPNDIIVINPDPIRTRNAVGIVRKRLYDMKIQSHLAGVDTGADVFFKNDEQSVTFTGIHRAKGNEAAMVYIINADDSMTATANLARVRNRLFTAITRSKAWVRVCGIGEEMDALIEEYDQVKEHDFALSFRYPTEEERATMQVLHRDMSRATEKRVKSYDKSIAGLAADLASGEVMLEDLDAETVANLRDLFTDAQD